MEVDTSWISSPASSAEEEMDQFVVEEIIIEEDGDVVSERWTVEDTWASTVHDISSPSLISCMDLTADSPTVLSGSTPDDSPSPSYILPHDSLTEEEDGLLDESFELMEDLMSMKENGAEWKYDSCDGETVAEKAQALLNHLDYIKQEPFSDWLEEKTELPLLEELGNYVNYQRPSVEMGLPAVPYHPRPAAVQTPHIGQIAPSLAQMVPGITLINNAHVPLSAQIPGQQVEMSTPQRLDLTSSPQQVDSPPPPLTPALIREFETVLHQTLTPPHTPPTILDLVNVQEEENKTINLEEDIDTLIKSQFESLYEDKPRDKVTEWVPVSTQDSPATSDWGSVSASNPTEDSDSACLSSSESDADWSPSVSRGHSGRSRRAVSSLEDRKSRKKEQNKNAATRYRMKKKAEQAGIIGEEVTLVDKNTALKEKATELQREIKYLKSLMRDICKAKGLIS